MKLTHTKTTTTPTANERKKKKKKIEKSEKAKSKKQKNEQKKRTSHHFQPNAFNHIRYRFQFFFFFVEEFGDICFVYPFLFSIIWISSEKIIYWNCRFFHCFSFLVFVFYKKNIQKIKRNIKLKRRIYLKVKRLIVRKFVFLFFLVHVMRKLMTKTALRRPAVRGVELKPKKKVKENICCRNMWMVTNKREIHFLFLSFAIIHKFVDL